MDSESDCGIGGLSVVLSKSKSSILVEVHETISFGCMVNKVQRGSTHRPSNGQPRQAYIKLKKVLDVTAYEMVSSSIRMHDCNNGSNCEVNGRWD